MKIDTIIFDLDGVLLDTEQVWLAVRRRFAEAHGRTWTKTDQRAAMGANSRQWTAYMREHCGIPLSDEQIYAGVIAGLREWYAHDLPVIPGAREAVFGLVPAYRLGLASSSPLELIEDALRLAGIRDCFAAVVSSDEVPRGKPEPDVYLEACTRLGSQPVTTAAVEDSSSGISSAAAAGLAVIAIPNPEFAPSATAVGRAAVVLGSISELTPAVVAALEEDRRRGLVE